MDSKGLPRDGVSFSVSPHCHAVSHTLTHFSLTLTRVTEQGFSHFLSARWKSTSNPRSVLYLPQLLVFILRARRATAVSVRGVWGLGGPQGGIAEEQRRCAGSRPAVPPRRTAQWLTVPPIFLKRPRPFVRRAVLSLQTVLKAAFSLTTSL